MPCCCGGVPCGDVAPRDVARSGLMHAEVSASGDVSTQEAVEGVRLLAAKGAAEAPVARLDDRLDGRLDDRLDDRLGRLALTLDGLEARDVMVRDCMSLQGVPVVVLLAGGYGRRVEDTVAINLATVGTFAS